MEMLQALALSPSLFFSTSLPHLCHRLHECRDILFQLLAYMCYEILPNDGRFKCKSHFQFIRSPLCTLYACPTPAFDNNCLVNSILYTIFSASLSVSLSNIRFPEPKKFGSVFGFFFIPSNQRFSIAFECSEISICIHVISNMK